MEVDWLGVLGASSLGLRPVRRHGFSFVFDQTPSGLLAALCFFMQAIAWEEGRSLCSIVSRFRLGKVLRYPTVFLGVNGLGRR